MRRKTNVHCGNSQPAVKKVKQDSTVPDKAVSEAMQPAHRRRKALIVLFSLIGLANPAMVQRMPAVRAPREAGAFGDCGG